jgi:hypothetical protein
VKVGKHRVQALGGDARVLIFGPLLEVREGESKFFIFSEQTVVDLLGARRKTP